MIMGSFGFLAGQRVAARQAFFGQYCQKVPFLGPKIVFLGQISNFGDIIQKCLHYHARTPKRQRCVLPKDSLEYGDNISMSEKSALS